MQLPATLSLRRSRRLAALLAGAHALAAAVVLSLALPWWLKIVLLAAILVSTWRRLNRLRGPGRICRLTLRADGRLEFSRVDGSCGVASVHPQTTVTAFLCVLLLRIQARVEALVLLPDALDAEDFRLLRLWLRWRAARSDL
ncbi:MAG TPA: protein YgfX [Rhodocyclaceae bacterium]|nr:protein YgfX [Rhodocyclaceae bacterium]